MSSVSYKSHISAHKGWTMNKRTPETSHQKDTWLQKSNKNVISIWKSSNKLSNEEVISIIEKI